jgi:DMSO/TMAO reductase YedYZ molybdopterin-dependent catalytic subunit
MKQAFLAAALATCVFAASAQEPPTITVSGAVQHPLTLTIADLKAMPGLDVAVSQQTDHGLAQDKFHGVLLWSLIDRAGLANGTEKNAYLRHTVLVAGTDGYAAALSEGEIDPKLEGKQVILAYEKDGAPLTAPRLVVPGDTHAARGVHDVVTVEVK